MIKSTRYGAKKHKAEPSIGLQVPKTGTVSFATSTAVAHRPEDNFDVEGGSSEEVEHPRLSIQVTIGLLIVVTVVSLLSFCLLLSCAEVYFGWSRLPLSG